MPNIQLKVTDNHRDCLIHSQCISFGHLVSHSAGGGPRPPGPPCPPGGPPRIRCARGHFSIKARHSSHVSAEARQSELISRALSALHRPRITLTFRLRRRRTPAPVLAHHAVPQSQRLAAALRLCRRRRRRRRVRRLRFGDALVDDGLVQVGEVRRIVGEFGAHVGEDVLSPQSAVLVQDGGAAERTVGDAL